MPEMRQVHVAAENASDGTLVIPYTRIIQFVCCRQWHFVFSKWEKDDWIRVDTEICCLQYTRKYIS